MKTQSKTRWIFGVILLLFVMSLVAAALPQPAVAAGSGKGKDKNWVSTCVYVTRVRNDESIKDVARRNFVSWRVLAKVNDIRPPHYEVDMGDRLCVPSRNLTMRMLKEMGY